MGSHLSVDVEIGDQPLKISKDKLIERLQERLDEEQTKRREAEDKARTARQELTNAIKTLTDDELTNVFLRLIVGDLKSGVKFIEDAKENEKFVSPALAPTKIEGDLEKFVRVLGMTEDTVIEVAPTEPIYRLL